MYFGSPSILYFQWINKFQAGPPPPPPGHLSGICDFVLEKRQMPQGWGRAFMQNPQGGA